MIRKLSLIALVYLFNVGAMAAQEGWTSRADVVDAGKTLVSSIGTLRDEIQTVSGPQELITKWSEFHVQLEKFVLGVESGNTYEQALMEFGDVMRTMYQIRSLMYKHKACCYLPEVRHKYNRVRLQFRKLDRHMNGETP